MIWPRRHPKGEFPSALAPRAAWSRLRQVVCLCADARYERARICGCGRIHSRLRDSLGGEERRLATQAQLQRAKAQHAVLRAVADTLTLSQSLVWSAHAVYTTQPNPTAYASSKYGVTCAFQHTLSRLVYIRHTT